MACAANNLDCHCETCTCDPCTCAPNKLCGCDNSAELVRQESFHNLDQGGDPSHPNTL